MPVWNVARAPEGAVYIGRGSRWGNPWVLGRDGDRADVIALYRVTLWAKIEHGALTLEDLAALDGQDLACHCKPLACHGDVLERAAAWAARELAEGGIVSRHVHEDVRRTSARAARGDRPA